MRFARRAARVLAVAAFAVGLYTGAKLVQLDRIVTSRFDGTRFQVPSRVLSAPTILYPGLDWQRVDLRGALSRLGYWEAPGGSPDLAPGQYRWGDGEARIHLRGFEHPSRPEPARQITLRLDDGYIEEIRHSVTGREYGAVLLEPEVVGSYFGPDREQRDLVRLAEVPAHLLHSVLAVEDQRFAQHHGIDFRRVGGALLANLRAREIRQGGSTLTQQLVKNFFLTPERTFERKLQEAMMAFLVELRYDKRAILEAYLNEIYLGQRGSTAVHGVGEASRLYFGKSARQLSVAEAALLAAIIQSPNGTSPFRAPERAIARRNLVLELMYEQGRIDAQTLRTARDEPLHLAPHTAEPRQARYFLDSLRRQLPEVYDADVLTSEGLRIYSTLDVRLQGLATKALREGLAQLETRFPHLRREDPTRALQGCLVALRPQTGEVLALVGGRDYGHSQFDRCTQARRPAGSVFKPFVYIAALEPRPGGPEITLASQLDDSPLVVSLPTGVWEPENFDHEFHGQVSVREALERSFNVATARLAQEVGIDRVADVARRLGIASPLPRVPSLALGVADVSPIEVARAYATLANGGIRPEVRSFEDVVDSEGRTLERRDIDFHRVLDAGTAYLATSLLAGVVDRGTAWLVRGSGLKGPIAGKTGTSDGERDAWFVGFTPELVVAVWVGFDEPESVGVPASRAALPIWNRFVADATGGRIRGRFLRPSDVVEVEIDPETGALALAGCPVRQPELFLAGTEPTRVCPSDYAGRDLDPRPGEDLQRLFLRWLQSVM